MPRTKNAMIRYQILDRLLSDQYHNYSLDDLTEIVSDELSELNPKSDGITRRSIEKDVFFIENENTPPAEIERYSVEYFNRERQKYMKKRCLRYANRSFSIFNQDMSDEERELLSAALSLLGQFEGLPQLDQLEALRINANVRQRKNKVIWLSKSPMEKSNILGQLFSIIINKQVIDITYRRFKQKEELHFVVTPYLLKEFNRRWYLICKDYNDETIRNLALDRMVSIKQLPSYKYEKPTESIVSRYDEIVGMTYLKENPIQHIVFWVSDRSDDYVITKPIHKTQKQLNGEEEAMLRANHPELKGGTFFSIDCRKNYELVRELMSYNCELVVLSPENIRKEITENLCNMVNLYKPVD